MRKLYRGLAEDEYEERVSIRRGFSETYHTTVKRILAVHLLVESSLDIDHHDAADMIFRVSGRGDIAVRIRHSKYREKYGHQITIRAANQECPKTELDKIIDGKATFFFYGFGCPDGVSIDPWCLLDLNAFRAALFRGHIRAQARQPNGDGTWFEVYNVADLRSVRDPAIVLAASK